MRAGDGTGKGTLGMDKISSVSDRMRVGLEASFWAL